MNPIPQPQLQTGGNMMPQPTPDRRSPGPVPEAEASAIKALVAFVDKLAWDWDGPVQGGSFNPRFIDRREIILEARQLVARYRKAKP